jgi:hypothetical protein
LEVHRMGRLEKSSGGQPPLAGKWPRFIPLDSKL